MNQGICFPRDRWTILHPDPSSDTCYLIRLLWKWMIKFQSVFSLVWRHLWFIIIAFDVSFRSRTGSSVHNLPIHVSRHWWRRSLLCRHLLPHAPPSRNWQSIHLCVHNHDSHCWCISLQAHQVSDDHFERVLRDLVPCWPFHGDHCK